ACWRRQPLQERGTDHAAPAPHESFVGSPIVEDDFRVGHASPLWQPGRAIIRATPEIAALFALASFCQNAHRRRRMAPKQRTHAHDPAAPIRSDQGAQPVAFSISPLAPMTARPKNILTFSQGAPAYFPSSS